MDSPALDEPGRWSLPICRILGVRVRLHALFLVVALGLVLRAGFSHGEERGIWGAALAIQTMLLFSVLLHELAHVATARLVGGQPDLILLWPLGGLVRHEPDADSLTGARLLVAAAGPMANLLACVACAIALFATGLRPPLDPFHDPLMAPAEMTSGALFLSRLFWINWILFLFNALVPALPLDAGECVAVLVGSRAGERAGTLAAVKASLCALLGCAVAAVALNDVLGLVLAVVIWISARHRMARLEAVDADYLPTEAFPGSVPLEMAPAVPSRSWWTRYRERAAARRLELEVEARRRDEERMDGLLEKLHRVGRDGLSAEERRFMELFASRCRDRQSGSRG
ncbi:MAG: site-2 protease family protein [Gemmataceae bacterium]